MSEAKKLWAVPFPIQKDQISAWCWGSGCGKGRIGAIDLGGLSAVPCVEASCPFLDKEMDEPMGTLDDGSDVYLRKLRDIPPVTASPEETKR